jgi:hypothetical protein
MSDEHELLDLLTDFMTLTVDPETERLNGVTVAGVHVADARFTRAVSMAMEWLDAKRAANN